MMADECPLNSVPLKVMIDKKNQRVAFAEADATFTDTLVSFLTLPLGTVVKLLSSHANSPSLGSTRNLYQSVESLQSDMFYSSDCKTMLLHPKNAAANAYRALQFKVDSSDWDQQETMCLCPSECSFGLYEGMKCICGLEMTKKCLSGSFTQSSAFINERVVLLIANNMRLMPLSTTTVKSALQAQGLVDRCNALEEKKVDVEVLQLLLSVLFSGTPLTDAVFPRNWQHISLLTNDTFLKNPKVELPETKETDEKKIHMKLVFRNSNKKLLYAEVGSDFLDLIFSFLTIPTGAIVKLLGKNCPFISLNSLSSSIKDPQIVNLLKKDSLKELLVNPKLAPSLKCDNQLLDLVEENYVLPYSVKRNFHLLIRNPKLPNLSGECGGNFLKGSEVFMVTDDLVVRPLSSTSIVSYLDGLKIPFSDVEEKDVKAGKCEALRLLKATLESTTVLTDAFDPFLGSSGK